MLNVSDVIGVDGRREPQSVYTEAWEAGERPDWWCSESLLWEFTLPTGRRFATSDLEAASSRLADRLRRPVDEVQAMLLTQTPLEARQSVVLADSDTTITAHHRLAYLRDQVRQLERLQSAVDDLRTGVIGDVVASVASAYAKSVTDARRLLDADDPDFYLGVDLRQLDRWAQERGASEVQAFVREEASRPPQPAPERKRRTGQHETLVRKHAWNITRFVGYFDAADYLPENDHERHAMKLHKAVRDARGAAEEERATIERDLYLIEHVFGK